MDISKDRANILTLDYGIDEQRLPNLELGVIFCSSDWNKLVPLLTDPACFMLMEQGNYAYKADADNKPAWELLPPVTAVLESGYGNEEYVRQFAQMMGIELAPDALNEAALLDRASFAEKRLAFLRPFFDRFRHGAFMAEFSVCTHTLFIRYFQPIDQSTVGRYKQSYSRATISAPVGVFEGAIVSTHFDLVTPEGGKVSTVDRAEFVVAYLENPCHVCDEINMTVTQKPLKKCASPMYESGASNVEVKKPDDYPDMSFRPYNTDPTTHPWPRLVIEGLDKRSCKDHPLDDPIPVEPCTNFVTTIAGSELLLGGGVVKAY